MLLGIPAAGLVALAAEPVLGLLGSDFRAEAATPLRVLLLALPPVLVLQLYYSVCRSTRRLPEAVAAGVLLGVAALAATAAVASQHGLAGMAFAWVAVQSAAGVWAAVRLVQLVPRAAGPPARPRSEPTADGRVRDLRLPGQAMGTSAKMGL